MILAGLGAFARFDVFKGATAMLRSMILTLVFLAGSAPLHAEVTHVDNAALKRLIEIGVPLVDIRTPEEWKETGIIEGSHLLTFFDAQGNYDVRAWLSALSDIAGSDEPVAIICHSGGRSDIVSRFLDAQVGYRQVHDAHQGISRWIAEGRSTVTP